MEPLRKRTKKKSAASPTTTTSSSKKRTLDDATTGALPPSTPTEKRTKTAAVEADDDAPAASASASLPAPASPLCGCGDRAANECGSSPGRGAAAAGGGRPARGVGDVRRGGEGDAARGSGGRSSQVLSRRGRGAQHHATENDRHEGGGSGSMRGGQPQRQGDGSHDDDDNRGTRDSGSSHGSARGQSRGGNATERGARSGKSQAKKERRTARRKEQAQERQASAAKTAAGVRAITPTAESSCCSRLAFVLLLGALAGAVAFFTLPMVLPQPVALGGVDFYTVLGVSAEDKLNDEWAAVVHGKARGALGRAADQSNTKEAHVLNIARDTLVDEWKLELYDALGHEGYVRSLGVKRAILFAIAGSLVGITAGWVLVA